MKKIILRAFLFLPVLSVVCTVSAHAQAVTSEDIKTQMVKDWERAKAYTIDYLNTMPTGKYSLKPNDSIRTFAQQMLHLATVNFFLMTTATDQAAPAYSNSDLEHSAGAQTKDSVMYYVTASYDFCIAAVKASDVNKWGEKKKVFGRFEETRLALIMKGFEHQTHHRGQTTIYIRVAGAKPPQERLF